MTTPLINNGSLEKFIQGVKMGRERKDFLLSKLPEMDFEERIALFQMLTKVKLLNLEEKKAIVRIKKFWVK